VIQKIAQGGTSHSPPIPPLTLLYTSAASSPRWPHCRTFCWGPTFDCRLRHETYAFTCTPSSRLFQAGSLYPCGCDCSTDELVVKSVWDSAENFALHKTSANIGSASSLVEIVPCKQM